MDTASGRGCAPGVAETQVERGATREATRSGRRARRGALGSGAAVAGALAFAPAALLAGGAREAPSLEARLGERVFGQAGAIATVAGVLRRAASRGAAAGRPAGSLLFVGPQGVGKTLL